MHVAMIADAGWLDEDLPMFLHLIGGLLDEQVRVVQVLPEQVSHQTVNGFAEHIAWRDSDWAMTRQHRISRLFDPLNDLGVDLIHALNARVWSGCARLAGRLRVPLVLGVNSASDLSQIKSLPKLEETTPVGFSCATEPLAASARQKKLPHSKAEVIPIGVNIPETPPAITHDPNALCAIINGNGIYDQDYDSLLNAISTVCEGSPQAQFFFNCSEPDHHPLWQSASRYGLLPNISFLPHRVGPSELLMQGDVFIQPQATGRSSSLTLHGMAHGMTILAKEDPWLDYLIDDQTAWLTTRPEPDGWTELIQRVIESPQRASALSQRAKTWVRQNHSADRYIDRTLGLYRELYGESIKFPQRDTRTES